LITAVDYQAEGITRQHEYAVFNSLNYVIPFHVNKRIEKSFLCVSSVFDGLCEVFLISFMTSFLFGADVTAVLGAKLNLLLLSFLCFIFSSLSLPLFMQVHLENNEANVLILTHLSI